MGTSKVTVCATSNPLCCTDLRNQSYARAALVRRSVRVTCAALFAPLSHGQARRAAWGELLHGDAPAEGRLPLR